MFPREEFLRALRLGAPRLDASWPLLLQFDTPDIAVVPITRKLLAKVRSGARLTDSDRQWIAINLEGYLGCWDVAPRASELHGPERRRLLRQMWLKQLEHINAYKEASAEWDLARRAFHDGVSYGLSYAQKLLTSGGESIHLDEEWYRSY